MDKQKEYNITMGFFMAAVAMLVCVANAKGQKLKPDDILSTATNIDAVIEGTGQPDTVCALIWKKRFRDGTLHTGTELKLNQIRAVHSLNDTDYISPDGKVIRWRDKCFDSTLGDWNLYQPIIYVWNKGKTKKFKEDTSNIYVIDEADLTKDQKDKVKEGKKNFGTLGNHRLKKELKQ